MSGKYEIYKDKKGEHRFRLKAGNGETILASEGYSSRKACDSGIASIQSNAASASQYERKEATNGKHYFVLKAKNHQVIGQSGMYESAASMETGIKSVMSNGPNAKIVDTTAS
jgi:uncharacterized protein YegP (UPF0339 family)